MKKSKKKKHQEPWTRADKLALLAIITQIVTWLITMLLSSGKGE